MDKTINFNNIKILIDGQETPFCGEILTLEVSTGNYDNSKKLENHELLFNPNHPDFIKDTK